MAQHSQHDSTPQKSSSAGDPPLQVWNAQLIEPGLEVAQPGLEVAPATEHDKQYINPVHEGDKEALDRAEKEVVTSQGYQITAAQLEPSQASPSPKPRKVFGLKRGWFWTLLGVVLLLIALAVGVRLGLNSKASRDSPDFTQNTFSASPKSSDSTQSAPSTSPTSPTPDKRPSNVMEIGGNIDPSYFSRSGVWNGAGSAIALQNFNDEFDDDIADQVYDRVLYFQHHTGEIRWMRQTANTTQPWQPGPSGSEVTSDAKNSTPLSTVNMLWSTSEWHVFYIDSENQVRHRKGNNISMSWAEGSTRQARLKAWDGDLVGLTACWGISNDFPVRLFYASSNATFEEYLWRRPDDTWHWQQSWEGFNGAASIRYYGGSTGNADEGANRYLVLINSNNQIEVWYQKKDDESLHWTKSKFLIDDAYPASSFGMTNDVIVWQEASTNLIKVKRIGWQGEDARVTDDFSPPEQNAGIPGTQINVIEFNKTVRILYQREGDDLTMMFRDSEFGRNSAWESMKMPV